MAKILMFQGTGSSVGKSVLIAGIARALTNKGYNVLPFKPQNMSNNAAVTIDGGEIGRAQALQAFACRVDPVVHMNPVLLKPHNVQGSQIIVQGKIWGQASAREYQEIKPQLLDYVIESFNLLKRKADIILIEGAGSASEINLRKNDIANMGFAQAVKAPVILIGDIDRGGVIASLIGTHKILSPNDLKLVKGFIVNKMRGDPSLFTETMEWISHKTGWKNCGLLPFFDELRKLPAEDAADLKADKSSYQYGKLHISVLLLPNIANFDDFDPLKNEPHILLEFISPGSVVPAFTKVIIIPGSKNTISDLNALYQTGWDIDIKAHVRRGGYVFGICGGYQMLGQQILDPLGIEESSNDRIKGLGFFKSDTILSSEKKLEAVTGHLALKDIDCEGYEMHVGQTKHHGTYKPFAYLDDSRAEGAISDNGQVIGTYLHGIFHCDEVRDYLLSYFGSSGDGILYEQQLDSVMNNWANFINDNILVDNLISLL